MGVELVQFEVGVYGLYVTTNSIELNFSSSRGDGHFDEGIN